MTMAVKVFLFGIAMTGATVAVSTFRTNDRVDDEHLERARRILSETPLIDGHNDLPWAIRNYEAAPMDVRAYDLRRRTPGHTDMPRLREGMVGAQFWSVYVPFAAVEEGAARYQLEQIDIARQLIELYPDVFELALTADEVEKVALALAEGELYFTLVPSGQPDQGTTGRTVDDLFS
jgi:hypothetical protein